MCVCESKNCHVVVCKHCIYTLNISGILNMLVVFSNGMVSFG